MKKVLDQLLHYFEPLPPIPSGIYTTQNIPILPNIQKVFLRVESDGTGVLILNASIVLHLNPVAVDMAYGIIQGLGEQETIGNIVRKYRVSKGTAEKDLKEFLQKLVTLTQRSDLDPEEFIEIERKIPYQTTHLSAPYRIDCALTYRLPQSTMTGLTPENRVKQELTTSQWKEMIQKSWQAGIPHVIFTGGEPTLREDLAELIAFTENIGQVCGIITDGLKLSDESYLNQLLQSGLDHVLITLDVDQEQSWNAIYKVASKDIFTVVHLTLSGDYQNQISEIVQRLLAAQINAISLSITDPLYGELLSTARDLCTTNGLKLVWDLPVPYSKFNPIAMDMVNEQIVDGAGRAWVYVEPDGDVLPAQGINVVLGNLLEDDWEKIWQKCQTYVHQATTTPN
ncbi:MAG: radical SAM protein [Anaerolineales bacterium]